MRYAFRSATTVALRAAAVSIVVAGCFSERPTSPGELATSVEGCRAAVAASGGLQAVVAIKNFAFVPDTVRVPRGTTVTWVNCDAAGTGAPAHTTTADGGAWRSPLLAASDAYSHDFDASGVYSYHCEPHPFMRAAVIVQ